MRFSSVYLALLAICTDGVDGYSLYNPKASSLISQKSVVQKTMSMTRRETIRMPTGAPQVPYKVSGICARYVFSVVDRF
jgi:hypothetical protein